ncbi:MAG: hypothetical protein HXX11_20620 [Desulfuromonadales bacterium]|nr:hypothetical protein [Desulfuromonadales bacterium]
MTRIISIAMLLIFLCIYFSGCGKSNGDQAKEQWEKETAKWKNSQQKPTKPMWR